MSWWGRLLQPLIAGNRRETDGQVSPSDTARDKQIIHPFDVIQRIDEALKNRNTSLDLSGNQLTELPEAVGRLTQLTDLNLSYNQLAELPEAVGRLTQLIYLDLSDNQLAELPEAVGRLTQLKVLALSGNQLAELPETLRQLAALEELYLQDNEPLALPAEVLGPEFSDVIINRAQPRKPMDILEYYFRTRGGPRPLNEAKLVLVGFGGAGKTSLVNRLVNDRFDPHEVKTEGIDITEWPVCLHDVDEVRLHIWDFGGQEIMHATHQFFLTQRSLYLLVLAGRQGREDADAEYWLNLLASFAADSPVILVLSKIKEHSFDINRRALRHKFPNVRDIVETDCADRTGLDTLRTLIRRETNALPHLRDQFPAAWFAIKDRLSAMAEDYLTLTATGYCARRTANLIHGRRRRWPASCTLWASPSTTRTIPVCATCMS